IKNALVALSLLCGMFIAQPAWSQEQPKPAPGGQPQQEQQAPANQAPVIIIRPGNFFRMFAGPSYDGVYRQVWSRIANSYYDVGALKNWGDWQHKYDGKLTTEEEMDAAIKAMVSSLNDHWTAYYSPSQQM